MCFAVRELCLTTYMMQLYLLGFRLYKHCLHTVRDLCHFHLAIRLWLVSREQKHSKGKGFFGFSC